MYVGIGHLSMIIEVLLPYPQPDSLGWYFKSNLTFWVKMAI